MILLGRLLGCHETSRSKPQHLDHGSQAGRDPLVQEIADLEAGGRTAGAGQGLIGRGGGGGRAEEIECLPSNLTLRGFRSITAVQARRGEEGGGDVVHDQGVGEQGDLSAREGGGAGGQALLGDEEWTDGGVVGRGEVGEEGKASGGGGDIRRSTIGPNGGHLEGRRRHA